MEDAGRLKPSPSTAKFGSFDAAYADMGALAGDFPLVLDHLREWDEGGVWRWPMLDDGARQLYFHLSSRLAT